MRFACPPYAAGKFVIVTVHAIVVEKTKDGPEIRY
jgi:hypothetical protein